ncbi:MAG: STAS/SEC14 domain-containing protein [Betaproteobacteria bacterium]
MLKLIAGLPTDVLAIEGSGRVTHEDYRNVLIPKAEAMMATGPIKMLYVLGKDFEGYDLEALWDDGTFGIAHWRDFSRVAVVGDQGWLRAAVSLFKPFFPCECRLFSLSELAAAKAWIANSRKPDA